MDIGFIGLGNMGFPIMRRLVAADYHVVVFDTRRCVVDRAVEPGASAASARAVADQAQPVEKLVGVTMGMKSAKLQGT